MLKLTEAQSAKLDCLCGACQHEPYSKACLYNKILESAHPEEAQKKAILKFMEEVFAAQKPKSPTQKRATIKKK